MVFDKACIAGPPVLLRQFTLIELLVVIAIIAILASILFPALRAAKIQAKMISEVNNMKQVGIALIYYGKDFNLRLPAANSGRRHNHSVVRDRLGMNNYITRLTYTDKNYGFDSIWGCPVGAHIYSKNRLVFFEARLKPAKKTCLDARGKIYAEHI